jgi:hypothetical protein
VNHATTPVSTASAVSSVVVAVNDSPITIKVHN